MPDGLNTPDGAQGLLKSVFGFDAFRPGQEPIVTAVAAGENVLAIISYLLLVVLLSMQSVTNYAPHLSIAYPVHLGTYTEGEALSLFADASDAEDGDLSDRIVWYSSVDGYLSSPVVLSLIVFIVSYLSQLF